MSVINNSLCFLKKTKEVSDHDQHQERSKEDFIPAVFLHTDYVERYFAMRMRGEEIMINSNCSVIGEKILAWIFRVRQKQLLGLCPRPGGRKLGHATSNRSTSGGFASLRGDVHANLSKSGVTGLIGAGPAEPNRRSEQRIVRIQREDT